MDRIWTVVGYTRTVKACALGVEQFTCQWASHDETPLRLERGAGPAFMCAAGDPETTLLSARVYAATASASAWAIAAIVALRRCSDLCDAVGCGLVGQEGTEDRLPVRQASQRSPIRSIL